MDFQDNETLIVALSALGGFAAIVAFVLPFLRRDQRASRMKVVSAHREELSRQRREELAQKRAQRNPRVHVNAMKNLLNRFAKLRDMTSSKELRLKLASAGWRKQSAVVVYVFSCLAASVAAVLVGLVVVTIWKPEYHILLRLLIAAGAGAVGFYLPSMMVKNTADKRRVAMTSTFPDSLDLLVICVEAGLSIEAAFARVTEEIADDAPILSQEFGLMSAELAFLGDRSKAYSNLADRTGLPAAKSLSTALSQSEKYGTPVSVALKILSQENREARMAAAEKKAGSLPAQLTVPMIVFFLPPLFVVIIGGPMIKIINM